MNMQLSFQKKPTATCIAQKEFSLTEVLKKKKGRKKKLFKTNFSYEKICHFVDDMKLQEGRRAKPKKVSLTTSRVRGEKAHTI